MRILVAGATGAIGGHLVPMLVADGHEVVGTTRTESKIASLAALGAEGVVMDGLDGASVRKVIGDVLPNVVIHELTALTTLRGFTNLDRDFALTNRLRTETTDHLLAAAREVGATRVLLQSFTGWPNERTGGLIKDENDPLDEHPAAKSRETLGAIRHVESKAGSHAGLDVLVLRYGGFYGPGTGFTVGGDMVEAVRRRRLPVVGGGHGLFSFVHIADAARATTNAVTRGAPGLYNVVDDEPAQMAVWVPYLADALGAKAPRRVPTWLVRPMIGEQGALLMTEGRGSSNAKAKTELGWPLRYPSWREGFRAGLS